MHKLPAAWSSAISHCHTIRLAEQRTRRQLTSAQPQLTADRGQSGRPRQQIRRTNQWTHVERPTHHSWYRLPTSQETSKPSKVASLIDIVVSVSSSNLCLRARPKAERVFAEYENFLKLSDPTDRPTDRDAFQRLISFEPSYRLTNGFRHLKATFNKSFVLA